MKAILLAVATFTIVCLMWFVVAKCSGFVMGTPDAGACVIGAFITASAASVVIFAGNRHD